MDLAATASLTLQAQGLDAARAALAAAQQQSVTAPATPAAHAAVILELSAAAQALVGASGHATRVS
jgi:hypothetical protein